MRKSEKSRSKTQQSKMKKSKKRKSEKARPRRTAKKQSRLLKFYPKPKYKTLDMGTALTQLNKIHRSAVLCFCFIFIFDVFRLFAELNKKEPILGRKAGHGSDPDHEELWSSMNPNFQKPYLDGNGRFAYLSETSV